MRTRSSFWSFPILLLLRWFKEDWPMGQAWKLRIKGPDSYKVTSSIHFRKFIRAGLKQSCPFFCFGEKFKNAGLDLDPERKALVRLLKIFSFIFQGATEKVRSTVYWVIKAGLISFIDDRLLAYPWFRVSTSSPIRYRPSQAFWWFSTAAFNLWTDSTNPSKPIHLLREERSWWCIKTSSR